MIHNCRERSLKDGIPAYGRLSFDLDRRDYSPCIFILFKLQDKGPDLAESFTFIPVPDSRAFVFINPGLS